MWSYEAAPLALTCKEENCRGVSRRAAPCGQELYDATARTLRAKILEGRREAILSLEPF